MRIRGRLLLARGYRISPIRRGRERQLPWQRQDRDQSRLVAATLPFPLSGVATPKRLLADTLRAYFATFGLEIYHPAQARVFSPSLWSLYFLLSIACLSESWLPAAPLIRITTRRPASFTSRTRTWLKCSS